MPEITTRMQAAQVCQLLQQSCPDDGIFLMLLRPDGEIADCHTNLDHTDLPELLRAIADDMESAAVRLAPIQGLPL